MSTQTSIQAHPETLWKKATAAVLTFDAAGVPDRILIKNGREVVNEVPAMKINRLEAKPRGSSFTLRIEYPEGAVRRTVSEVLLRFGNGPQNRDDMVVDTILFRTATEPTYKYMNWLRRP